MIDVTKRDDTVELVSVTFDSGITVSTSVGDAEMLRDKLVGLLGVEEESRRDRARRGRGRSTGQTRSWPHEHSACSQNPSSNILGCFGPKSQGRAFEWHQFEKC